MHVTVRLFAGLREQLGPQLDAELPADATVADLERDLAARWPALAAQLACVAVAVNEEYVPGRTAPLRDGDVVALIPPVSGGAPGAPCPHFLVTSEPLDRDAIRALVLTPASGAVVLFEGVVRNHHQGHPVLRLEYEAYASMAERELAAVATEVRAEYATREVHDVAAHHRTGLLEVGDVSLLVAVSAAHREDAFAAALRCVDRIKETVPVWKKEYGPDGATWQEGILPQPRA
jgi:molybdopterin synthase catalytic subunit